MSYVKTEWATGDVITAQKLNNMEDGIEALDEYADIFTADVSESVENWLDDHPEATTTVEDNAITTPKLQDGAVTTPKLANGSVTDDKLASDGIKAEVSDLKSDLDNIDIENYIHPSEQIVGVLTKNYFVGIDGVPVSINGYAYLTVECEPKTTYLLSGINGSGSARLFVVKDSNGNVIDAAPSGSGLTAKDYEYTTPSNASTLIVNTWFSSQPPIAKVYYPHEYVPNIPFVKQSGNDSLTIEDYVHPIETIEGTVTDGYYMDREGYPTAIAHFHYLTINCEPNTTYYISGNSGNRNRLFIVKDIMDNVIYVYPTYEGGVHNYEYTTPSNAHTLIVNGYDSASLTARVEKYEYTEFIKGTPLAKLVSENVYTIGNEDYSIRVLLNGSNNGAFNFSDFNRNGVKFKNEGDDVTPIWMTGAGYAGGNHGFEFGYRLTITSHGLTESDIGKTYNDGSNTWVLIKIIAADVIQVVCYDSSVWYKAKTATVPNSVNFGSPLSVESSVKAQIYPSIKNVNVEVIKNTKDECLILETYDVIHLGSGIDALISNVGDNTNDSLATLSDSAFTIRNLYSFLNNGSVAIHQNLKATSGGISLGWYGGTQSMGLPNPNYIAVAETNITFQAVGGNSIEFSRSTWNDNTKPPILYMQADGASGNNVMFLGYICKNRNSELQDTVGKVDSSEKMYPMFINPNRVVNKGEVFNCVSFRIPCHINDVSNKVAYVCYTKVYDDYYVIISPNSATNTEVKLPNNLWNKKCEVYMSDGVTCATEYVTDSVDIISEGRGYLILKLSK